MKRVLLVRLDGIGDAVVCTPLIAALREAGHAVGLALSDRNAAVFAAGTAIATHVLERIPWPQHGSTALSRALAQAEIAALRYDVALVASEEPEAYDLAGSVPQRIGFTNGWAKPLKSVWARRRLTTALVRAASIEREPRHEVETLFRLGAGLVEESAPARDASRLRSWIAGEGAVPVRSGIVVQLGEKWRAGGIADDVLLQLIASLAGREVRLIAAPAERDALAARWPNLEIAAPATTRAWIAALDAAQAVVSVDTGAAHLAGMLGVPVVDVFPDAHFEAQTRRWRPWAAASIVLRASQVAAAPETLVAQALDAF